MNIEQRIQDLGALLADFNLEWKPDCYDEERRWSYGDVENNGVYYHPQLTHYAHQAFEQFFLSQCGIQYADLSGKEGWNFEARKNCSPPIEHRITFPVGSLYQFMLRPMYAGDLYRIWIDTIDLSTTRIGVRAHIFDKQEILSALVIWVRVARLLEPESRIVPIPPWFPKRERLTNEHERCSGGRATTQEQ